MVRRETACLVAYRKGLGFEFYRCRWIFSLDFLFLVNNLHKHIYIKN